MRVALNATILQGPRTGIGQYLAELFGALQNQADLELQLFTGWRWQQELPNASLPGYSRLSGVIKRCVPAAYQLRRQLGQLRFSQGAGAADVYHDPHLWPFEFNGPRVMTLHDLIHIHHPETQPRDRLAEIERHVANSIERVQHILVDSSFIANEACHHYGVPRSRITVAPLGCASRFHPRSTEQLEAPLADLGLQPGRYLLCIGTLEPRKNLQLALRAFENLPAPLRARYPLVVVGMPGWRTDQLDRSLQVALTHGQVRLLGYQPDETVAQLLAGARLLIFPSLYEGFGLPVLEAMASGTPVILTRASALPEVAGSAGNFIGTEDDSACSELIQKLVEDEEFWLQRREAGLERARSFSWQRCAQITADVYRHVVRQ